MFHDRIDAGKQLAAKLIHLRDESPVVLGLPRGGVVVGDPIAGELECPLDIIVVRKLGAPSHQELGIGAIAEHDVKVVNDELIEYLRVSEADLRAVEERERDELRRRVERYRRGKPEIDLGGRAAIIVDDGLATGYTARAAIHAARVRKAAKIVLAVPVGAEDTVQTLRALADDVVAISVPRDLRAVGYWYRDFAQTSDREVLTLLAQHE